MFFLCCVASYQPPETSGNGCSSHPVSWVLDDLAIWDFFLCGSCGFRGCWLRRVLIGRAVLLHWMIVFRLGGQKADKYIALAWTNHFIISHETHSHFSDVKRLKGFMCCVIVGRPSFPLFFFFLSFIPMQYLCFFLYILFLLFHSYPNRQSDTHTDISTCTHTLTHSPKETLNPFCYSCILE